MYIHIHTSLDSLSIQFQLSKARNKLSSEISCRNQLYKFSLLHYFILNLISNQTEPSQVFSLPRKSKKFLFFFFLLFPSFPVNQTNHATDESINSTKK